MTVRPAAPALSRLEAVLADLVGRGIVPGGVAAIASRRGVEWEHAFGRRALLPEPEPASLDTVYDLASLTKPLVTAALWLHARARGACEFAQPITDLVPEMRPQRGDPRAPGIGELLLHAGGLPSWKPLHALAGDSLADRAAWLARHREAPGRSAVYGCPGYQVLGLALERLHGRPLAELAREILLPGLEGAHPGPLPESLRRLAAPTEAGNVREAEMTRQEGEDLPPRAGFRTEMIRGDVHDHCAFTAAGFAGTAGGFAGNAGLFATARAVGEFCARILRDEQGDLHELSRDLAPHLDGGGECRSWGFQLARSINSPASDAVDDRAFGHAGFTGTSILLDPSRGAAYVLLTNRIHPSVTDVAFHAERRRFHEVAVLAAGAFVD